jgi:hypothetical protein
MFGAIQMLEQVGKVVELLYAKVFFLPNILIIIIFTSRVTIT